LKQQESSSEHGRTVIDKDKVLQAFYLYQTVKNETVPTETLLAWIDKFESMGLSTEQVLILIKEAEFKKIYGKTSFDVFLNEEDSYIDNELINQKANQKCWELLSNFGITPQTIREDYANKLIYASLQSENEKMGQRLLTAGNETNERIKEYLIKLSKEIPASDYQAIKIIKKKINQL